MFRTIQFKITAALVGVSLLLVIATTLAMPRLFAIEDGVHDVAQITLPVSQTALELAIDSSVLEADILELQSADTLGELARKQQNLNSGFSEFQSELRELTELSLAERNRLLEAQSLSDDVAKSVNGLTNSQTKVLELAARIVSQNQGLEAVGEQFKRAIDTKSAQIVDKLGRSSDDVMAILPSDQIASMVQQLVYFDVDTLHNLYALQHSVEAIDRHHLLWSIQNSAGAAAASGQPTPVLDAGYVADLIEINNGIGTALDRLPDMWRLDIAKHHAIFAARLTHLRSLPTSSNGDFVSADHQHEPVFPAALDAVGYHNQLMSMIRPLFDEAFIAMMTTAGDVEMLADNGPIGEAVNALIEGDVGLLRALFELKINIDNVVQSAQLLLTASNEADVAQAGAVIADYETAIKQLAASVGDTAIGDIETLAGTLLATINDEGGLLALRREQLASIAAADLAMRSVADVTRDLKMMLRTISDNVREQSVLTVTEIGAATHWVLVQLVGLSLFALMIATIVGLYFVRKAVILPLRQLQKSMCALSRGELTVQLPKAGPDEIGDMVKAVAVFQKTAQMNEELKTKETETQLQMAENAKRARHELANDLEKQIGTILEALADDTMELAYSSESLTDTTKRATAASRNVTETVARSRAQVENAVDTTAGLSQAVSAIDDDAKNVQSIVATVVAETRNASGEAGQLAAAVNEISQIVTMIAKISHQTNLLALNANIEAQRAGVHGRGFAVVAEEVKRLAVETFDATDSVQRNIGALQQASCATQSALNQIASSMDRVNDVADQTASAVANQSDATRLIDQAHAATIDASAAVESEVDGLVSMCDLCNETAASVQSASGHIATLSTELRAQTDRMLAQLREAA